MILDRPNHICGITIFLVGYKSFWLGPNHFGQVQIRLFWTNFYNLNLPKMIWTWPKWIGPVQNEHYLTKMIWSVQNHFGPIEGQGIRFLFTLSWLNFEPKKIVKLHWPPYSHFDLTKRSRYKKLRRICNKIISTNTYLTYCIWYLLFSCLQHFLKNQETNSFVLRQI